MNIIASLPFVATLLIAACASPPLEQNEGQTTTASPAAPLLYHYRCESGAVIAATYPATDSAVVQYKGSSYNMQIAISGSGARYVGGELEWWTKGPEGMLLHHNADGMPGDRIELCREY